MARVRMPSPRVMRYLVINSGTFCVDLAILSALHGALRWPVPASVTVSYLVAFALSYALNRSLNFRSHGPLGAQLPVYALVVAVNYLAWILGLTSALAALGLDYRLARVAAGACEAVYLYLAMRWLVFRDVLGAAEQAEAASPGR